MNTIRLTDAELDMTRHALQSYLQDFGHDEADTVAQIKRVIVKLREAEPGGDEPRFIA
jgi:hypothetical protein